MRDDRDALGVGPRDELLNRWVVANVLVSVRHHGAATVPAAIADDVHLLREEGVRGAHN